VLQAYRAVENAASLTLWADLLVRLTAVDVCDCQLQQRDAEIIVAEFSNDS